MAFAKVIKTTYKNNLNMRKFIAKQKTVVDMPATLRDTVVGEEYMLEVSANICMETVRNAIVRLGQRGEGKWKVAKQDNLHYVITRTK